MSQNSVNKSISANPPTFSSRYKCHEAKIAFLLGLFVMAYVQSGSYEPTDRDGFYHVKMATLLPQIGFPEKFPWLRHTILNDNNVNHHHGFHMLMVPFIYASTWLADLMPDKLHRWVENPNNDVVVTGFKAWIKGWLKYPNILGCKILVCVLFGLIVWLINKILRELNVGLRLFWLCAFVALPAEFFLRMSYIRAPIASLACLLLTILFYIKGRFFLVGLMGLIYAHVYGGFVFYPCVIGSLVLADLITRQPTQKFLLPLTTAAIGSIIGIISNPFFPKNLNFLVVQIFQTGLQLDEVVKVNVGVEWKPYDMEKFIPMAAFILITFAVTFALRFSWKRLSSPHTLALLIMNVIFFYFCWHSRRFIEYWPAFCLLSSASFWSDFDQTWSQTIKTANQFWASLSHSLTSASQQVNTKRNTPMNDAEDAIKIQNDKNSIQNNIPPLIHKDSHSFSYKEDNFLNKNPLGDPQNTYTNNSNTNQNPNNANLSNASHNSAGLNNANLDNANLNNPNFNNPKNVSAYSTKHISIFSGYTIIYITSLSKRFYTVICLASLISGCFSVDAAKRIGTSSFNLFEIQDAMGWMIKNTPEKSLVFPDDWDMFPIYFFYNNHNYYVCGLDPQFTNSMNPILWERYCVITQGRSPKKSTVQVRSPNSKLWKPIYDRKSFEVDLADIKNYFEADYVIVDREHRAFYTKMLDSPDLFEYKFPPTPTGRPPKMPPEYSIFMVKK